LISTEDDVAGFGHAWTEIYHKDKWLLLDATAPEGLVSDETACYLSLMPLDDEGPGYGVNFMRLINVQSARISKIRGISP
jgi:hypothetical protein